MEHRSGMGMRKAGMALLSYVFFKDFFFLMWTGFEVFLISQYYFCFAFGLLTVKMWDLNFPTRTHNPGTGR